MSETGAQTILPHGNNSIPFPRSLRPKIREKNDLHFESIIHTPQCPASRIGFAFLMLPLNKLSKTSPYFQTITIHPLPPSLSLFGSTSLRLLNQDQNKPSEPNRPPLQAKGWSGWIILRPDYCSVMFSNCPIGTGMHGIFGCKFLVYVHTKTRDFVHIHVSVLHGGRAWEYLP